MYDVVLMVIGHLNSLAFLIARLSLYFFVYFCYFQIYYSKKAKDMKEAKKIAENE
jgi:Ca2+/Na+ antiporter